MNVFLRTSLLSLVTLGSTIWITETPSIAQGLDYSQMEQLFGEPVTTSVTGKPQRVSDAAANVTIITADDIRRSGADNLPDILNFVAGLDVRRYGFAAADVAVRGYNEPSNPRLLVLLNGQQVYLDDLGRTQWYTIPVQLPEIRQIEVIKGPNTALFGFNAASGVVNIITYDPLRDDVNNITTRVGTQSYGSLSAVGTARVDDRYGIRVSAGGFRARDFAPSTFKGEDLQYRRSPQVGSVSFDGRARLGTSTEINLAGSALNNRIWEATASPFYGTDFQRTNALKLGLTAETGLGQVGLTVYRNELRYTYAGATERSDLHDTVNVVQLNDVFHVGTKHWVRFELGYRKNEASSSAILPGHFGYQVFSGSAMWDWQILEQVTATNAVRIDRFSLSQYGPVPAASPFSARSYNDRVIYEPSFNSGIAWKATDFDTFRITGSRGVQLPSIYDLALQDREPSVGSYPAYYYLGNPRLSAVSIWNIETGWDRKIPDLNSTTRISVFAQRTDNIITNPYEAAPVANGNELVATASNVGHSSALGTELELNGHSDTGWRWGASYSYISVADHLTVN